MKHVTGIIFLYLCCSCGKNVDWQSHFTGTWNTENDSTPFRETWVKKGETMEGCGVLFNTKGDTVFCEKLRIEERDENLVYIAWPGGKRRVEFTGKMDEEGRYSFTNEKNSFPSHIQYRFINNRAEVILTGTENDKKKELKLNFIKS